MDGSVSMNLVIGLLLLASMVTLLWDRERTWVIAIAQGLGLQGVLALASSALQNFVMRHDLSGIERVRTIFEGTAYNLGGWLSQTISTAAQQGTVVEEIAATPQQLLPFAAGQAALVSLVIAWRSMREETLISPLTILMVFALIGNSGAGASWEWWNA